MILLFCRPMKLIKYSFILAVLCCSFFDCKKSDNKNTPRSAITIQGFFLTDYNGNSLSWNGPADSDWLFRPGLSAAEMALFNFDTQLSLDNTKMTTIPFNIEAFPNPASVVQLYSFSCYDSNVIKLVIVDSNLNVLKKKAIKWGSGSRSFGSTVQIDLSDKTLFPDHSSRRAYFSYSAKDHPDYKAGYGDIRICYGTTVSGCF